MWKPCGAQQQGTESINLVWKCNTKECSLVLKSKEADRELWASKTPSDIVALHLWDDSVYGKRKEEKGENKQDHTQRDANDKLWV